MTPTRRDMLKLVAAMTATTPIAPFAVTPERAAAQLNEPAEFDPGPGRPNLHDADELESISFAEAVDGVDWEDWFMHGAAPEMAAYKAAFARVLEHFGLPGSALRGTDNPLVELDQNALAMWVTSWMAGVRAGAAYEHLRMALVSPRQACRICHGNGRTWGGSPYKIDDTGDNAAACTACTGLGHVATPPATLQGFGIGGAA